MKVPSCRLLFAVLAIVSLLCVPVTYAAGGRELTPAGVADGPGIWANVWNYPTGDLDSYCSKLRSFGVRNLFIQSTRTNMPAIAHAQELGQLIDVCHKYNIRVIAWAYLELGDPVADADKMIAAARYQSHNGEALDGIAPDLEKNLTADRLERFSSRLRHTLGSNYPIMAVVYSPLNHYQEVANIPWSTLAKYYDVIAPMCYWNSKYQKLDAYDYTAATVRTIRQMSGHPEIEIHVIGDGMGTSGEAITQFMKACRKAEATSASIYPNQRPTAEQLASLSHYAEFFQPNSRFRLAAFRQMLRSGALGSQVQSSQFDPAEPISRADFYYMVSHYLHIPLPTPDPVVSPMAPIYADEALGVLAQIVDVHQSNQTKKRRADRWFATPAMAESSPRKNDKDEPLNLLDASQMVLQVSSAMR